MIPRDAVRIFVNSAAIPTPGFIVRPGTVALPLMLDGRMSEISLDTTSTDPTAVERRLEETILSYNLPSFVNQTNKFAIYPTAREFQARHRPPWIAKIAHHIETTIDAYAAGEGHIISALFMYDPLQLLHALWQRMEIHLGSLLYLGIPENDMRLFDRLSYTFISRRLTNSITDTLFIIRMLNLIDIDYHHKLKPLYGANKPDNSGYDAFFEAGDFSQIEADIIDNEGMRNQVIIPAHNRPLEILLRDDKGNMSSRRFHISPQIVDKALYVATSDTGMLMGMFVCAAFNVSIDEIVMMFQRTDAPPSKIVVDFLMQKRGIDYSSAEDASDLMTAVLSALHSRNFEGNSRPV